MSRHVVILGAGLAGLSCAYELALGGVKVTVLEREPYPGGMASSFTDEDALGSWTHDFGPHRFHTHDEALQEHVRHILGDNHRKAIRLSRIALHGKFFDYPLRAGNVLRNLPPRILLRAFLDYGWVRFTERTGLSHLSDDNFEGWVTRRFGRTLYDLFFGRYTGKAWKMPPDQISGDWASQRISLLSLGDTVRKALFKPVASGTPRGLVLEFLYPAQGGIGEIARGYVRHIEAAGGRVLTGAPAVRLLHENGRVAGVRYGGSARGVITADHYISTIPITVLARSAQPAPPADVLGAISALQHVSIIFVYLKVDKPQVSPDSWMYLPEHHLTVHRISEFKNFSPDCAPPGRTMVCAEITCRIGDEHWRASDEELIDTAASDLEKIGLIERREVLDGAFVKRIPHAYPVYDLEYKEHLAPVLEYVHGFENLQTGGRQGLFRYNNMDQSIEMGRRMAWSVLQGEDAGHEAVAAGQEYFG